MKLPRYFGWIICLTAVVYMTGCKDEPASKPGKMEQAEEDHHDHDHSGHDHHDHEEGPHKGHIIELGDEEYHAEVTLDEKSKKLTLYIYGPELKKAVAIEQKEVIASLEVEEKPTEIKLAASPQEGDAEGKSSRFETTLTGDVAKHVHDSEDIYGSVKLKINGTDFEGSIEHDHDHGDHDHGDHDDHDHDDHKDHDHDDKDHDHKDEKKDDKK